MSKYLKIWDGYNTNGIGNDFGQREQKLNVFDSLADLANDCTLINEKIYDLTLIDPVTIYRDIKDELGRQNNQKLLDERKAKEAQFEKLKAELGL